jgi:type I restriction enzyme M protein
VALVGSGAPPEANSLRRASQPPQPMTSTSAAPSQQPSGKQNLSAFIWSVADLLRGDYKQSDYGKVILPFTVLRRLDCVLEPTKAAVLEEKALREGQGLDPEPFLLRKAGHNFCNTSPLNMKRLMGDGDNIAENLRSYIQGFSPAVRDIFENFKFHVQVDELDKANLLYLVTEKFGQIDLHPETVRNAEMGLVFEELIRKFAELSNETAGEHFTPREVIKLMVNLIFIEDDEALTQPGIVRSLYDPTAGTGGMLSVAEEHLVSHNPSARLVLSGQELNTESYAICKADMLIKGQDIHSICYGNTLSDDQLPEQKYDYMLSNPPFGVEWKKIQKEVQREAELMGYSGRFGPGLPRVSAAHCSSCSTSSARCGPPRTVAAVSASFSTAHHCLLAAQARARARSVVTCWRTTWWRRSSPCRQTCSTTRASAPTSGSSATASLPSERARCS